MRSTDILVKKSKIDNFYSIAEILVGLRKTFEILYTEKQKSNVPQIQMQKSFLLKNHPKID